MRLAVHELGCNSVALDRCQVRSGCAFRSSNTGRGGTAVVGRERCASAPGVRLLQ